MKEFGATKTEGEGKVFVLTAGNQLSSDAVPYPGITVTSGTSVLCCVKLQD